MMSSEEAASNEIDTTTPTRKRSRTHTDIPDSTHDDREIWKLRRHIDKQDRKHRQLQYELNQKIISLQQENKQLQLIQDSAQGLKLDLNQEKQKNEQLSKQLQSMNIQIHQTEDKNQDIVEQMKQMRKANADLEVANLKIQALERQVDLENDYTKLYEKKCQEVKELKLRLHDFTEENNMLKKKRQDERVLQEKILSLEKKLKRSECHIEKVMKAHIRGGDESLAVWKQAIDSIFPGLENTVDLTSKIRDMRHQVQQSILEVGEARKQIESYRGQLEAATRDLNQTKLLASQYQSERDSIATNVKNLEQKLQEEEILRRSLGNILKACSDDEAEAASVNDNDKLMLIQSLEKRLTSKEQELAQFQGSNSVISDLHEENRLLSRKLDKAMTEVGILKSRLGIGEYNPKMTKVLRLRRPDDQKEPEKKTKRLLELEKELAECKKAHDRLKQVYADVSRDIKNVYYRLTGYVVDVVGKRKYRIKSMFFEHQDDRLIFGMSKDNGTLSLLFGESVCKGPILNEISHQLNSVDSIMSFPRIMCSLCLRLADSHGD